MPKLTTHDASDDVRDLEPPEDGLAPVEVVSTRTDQVTVLWAERPAVRFELEGESVGDLEELAKLMEGV